MKSEFEGQINQKNEEDENQHYLESLEPDMMREKIMILLGTVDACLDNLENLKHNLSIGESTRKDQREKRVEFRNIISDLVNQVNIMLGTKKIELDKCLTSFSEEKQQRVNNLLEQGVMDYIVAHDLN
jgi:hypothetical protein